ncbi:MAG TPA: DUF1684 domain-containing protein [Gemmatimonadaceae bacterium]
MTNRRTLLLILMVVGCERWPEAPPLTREEHAADFAEWRQARRSALVRPGSGAVTWVGLWDLPNGTFTVGSDDASDIFLLHDDVPPRLGTFVRSDDSIRFTPAPGARPMIGDSLLITSTIDVVTDRARDATVIGAGPYRLRVHGEPGTDRLWIRAWDEAHPARDTFQLPEPYPLAAEWRVMARFDSLPSVREFRVADIAEGTQAYRSPGELVFRIAGREHRLAVSADSGSRDYFIMLWDSTALSTTYDAGRYLRVPLADSTGWTVIDFNRTYNPPCVFTAFSTCAFPPPENRLPLAITAGEKRVRW